MKLITRALMLIILTACAMPSIAQKKNVLVVRTDTLHCIPIGESRKLHEDAVKKYSLDSAVSEQGRQIALKDNELDIQWQYANDLIGDEQMKFEAALKAMDKCDERASSAIQRAEKAEGKIKNKNWQIAGAVLLNVVKTVLILALVL
jgi:hypothetical protein